MRRAQQNTTTKASAETIKSELDLDSIHCSKRVKTSEKEEVKRKIVAKHSNAKTIAELATTDNLKLFDTRIRTIRAGFKKSSEIGLAVAERLRFI